MHDATQTLSQLKDIMSTMVGVDPSEIEPEHALGVDLEFADEVSLKQLIIRINRAFDLSISLEEIEEKFPVAENILVAELAQLITEEVELG